MTVDQSHIFHRCYRWLTSYLTLCFYLAVDSSAVLASVDVGSHSRIIFFYCHCLMCLYCYFATTTYSVKFTWDFFHKST